MIIYYCSLIVDDSETNSAPLCIRMYRRKVHVLDQHQQRLRPCLGLAFEREHS